jgi:hypothetical protein
MPGLYWAHLIIYQPPPPAKWSERAIRRTRNILLPSASATQKKTNISILPGCPIASPIRTFYYTLSIPFCHSPDSLHISSVQTHMSFGGLDLAIPIIGTNTVSGIFAKPTVAAVRVWTYWPGGGLSPERSDPKVNAMGCSPAHRFTGNQAFSVPHRCRRFV